MNSEKVRYFLSVSDKINDEAFMVVFSVFSSRKKTISFEYSPFGRSLSFEGPLFPLGRCLSFGRPLSFRIFSFYRIDIS